MKKIMMVYLDCMCACVGRGWGGEGGELQQRVGWPCSEHDQVDGQDPRKGSAALTSPPPKAQPLA